MLASIARRPSQTTSGTVLNTVGRWRPDTGFSRRYESGFTSATTSGGATFAGIFGLALHNGPPHEGQSINDKCLVP